MSKEADEYWDKVILPIWKSMGLTPPTMEEAQKAFDNAGEVPLTDLQVAETIQYAVGDESRTLMEWSGHFQPLHRLDRRGSTLVELWFEAGVWIPKQSWKVRGTFVSPDSPVLVKAFVSETEFHEWTVECEEGHNKALIHYHTKQGKVRRLCSWWRPYIKVGGQEIDLEQFTEIENTD
jgi:hypothetical protein